MKNRNLFIFSSLLLLNIFVSCNFDNNDLNKIEIDKNQIENQESNEKVEEKKSRLWTFIIYMAADNNLESAALEDFCEMELSSLNTDLVSVFILLDRSNSYDTSNENWHGARLYKLKTGRDKTCSKLISEEMQFDELGLITGVNTAIDMASGYNLTHTLSFVKKNYPAQYYGFIMWGHGTGWRSNSNKESYYKGFAHDDSSGKYMTLSQFHSAVKKSIGNEKFDFIGLDTCFSGEIEVMYEIKECANYVVGSEGLLLMSGWNYKEIFNRFEKTKMKNPRELADIVVEEFENEYNAATRAAIVAVDLTKINEYFKCFDNIMKIVSENITNREERDIIYNNLASSKNRETISYSHGTPGSDVYLDIDSMLKTILKFINNDELKQEYEKYKNINKNFIIKKWSSEIDAGGLGIYFGKLTEGNVMSSVHEGEYIQGKTIQQIEFVKDSMWYVPNNLNRNSFLNKLFYTTF